MSVKSVLLALLLALAAGRASADALSDYPTSPVRMIVPFAPGGATDVVARIFIDQLSARWGGKPIVIENRPGAGTVIGANVVAKAPADGYTLGMIVGSFMTNAAVSANLPYDSAKDFAPLPRKFPQFVVTANVLLSGSADAPMEMAIAVPS
jgi:tripartite-type tricarboxylate transporter receptor subunit TctC